METIH